MLSARSTLLRCLPARSAYPVRQPAGRLLVQRALSSAGTTAPKSKSGGGSSGGGGSGGGTSWVNPLATPSGDALKKYGSDLTQMAREGRLDPVVGRDEEIRRTVQVLSRRRKNNPVLIGEPGVGKTAVVEGLAQRIADAEVLHRATPPRAPPLPSQPNL